MKPHKHAEFIKAWAEGAKIQSRRIDVVLTSLPPKYPDFEEDLHPTWSSNMEYRINPNQPKYPETKMTNDELHFAGITAGNMWAMQARAVANAAIARAIEDGQVEVVKGAS